MSYAGSGAHLQLCRPDDLPIYFPPFSESSDNFADSAVGEPRMALYPTLSSQLHPRRIYTRQNSEGNIRPLNPHLFTAHHHQVYQSSPSFTNVPPHQQWPRESQSWSPQYHSVPASMKQPDGHLHYPPFSTPSPFPQSPLSPSGLHHPKRTSPSGGLTAPGNRLAFTETVDPTTGLLLRTPEHPRLRTAQACQKCRLRKAKCSGEHPTCERCVTRGLVCEYAKEGRVRGPNKPKGKSSGHSGGNEASTGSDNATSTQNGRMGARPRTSSATSSTGSSETIDFTPVRHSFENTDLELDPKVTGGGVGPSRRRSFSLDDSASAQSCRLEIVTESKGFRRPSIARYSSMFADADHFSLPTELTPGGGVRTTGVDHQHHYDIHGNSLLLQDNFGFSSSLTIRHLHRESASLHLPTDHPLSLEMPQSALIPMGFTGPSAIQSDSIKSQDMMFQTIPCHHQHDEVSGPFNRSLSSNCGSPATASSIGSPLTPDSTATSMSLLPSIHSHLPSQDSKFNSSSELTYNFGLESAVAPSPSTSHGHPRLQRERQNSYGYLSIC